MADVFLSYARASAKQAMRTAESLRSSGFSVWFDESLPAHRVYSDVIAEQLEAANAVLVLWSHEAVQSQWVRSEANRGRETGRLVQVRVDDARLPMPFDQIQCADLRGWRGENNSAWRSVLTAVGALTENPAVAKTAQSPTTQRYAVNRRQLLIAGGTVAAVAAIGNAAWTSFNKPRSSPEAQLLLQKGLDALQSNDALEAETVGSTAQAIALLTDATEADPKSATAWGALAMAYAVRKRAADPAERAGLEARSRSAAASALDIDEDEPRAMAALRLLDPVYRNWVEAERADREALGKHPRHPILLFVASDMLGSVGRWKEANQLSDKLDRTKFLIPGADRKVIVNQWSAGSLQAADKAVQIAVDHWPDHPQVWRTRLAYLMYTGRPQETLAILGDPNQRPSAIPAGFVDAIGATARALAGQGAAREAVVANLAYVKQRAASAPFVAQACAALGDVTTAFSLLSGYYFSEGEWASVAPPGGDEDRLTSPLFQPPMRNLWRDDRFNKLIARIGLNTYWSQSGTMPDYRRAV